MSLIQLLMAAMVGIVPYSSPTGPYPANGHYGVCHNLGRVDLAAKDHPTGLLSVDGHYPGDMRYLKVNGP